MNTEQYLWGIADENGVPASFNDHKQEIIEKFTSSLLTEVLFTGSVSKLKMEEIAEESICYYINPVGV